jgi:hypothetical protein
MKLIRISAVAFLFLTAISCTEMREADAPLTPSLQNTDALQQCLDSKMEQWYKAFNHYQLEGYNMFAADLKALQEANAVYENCRAQNLTSVVK